ncbi:MAG: hypothetical protein NC548_46020 [Lachnospiraceae bacterium]|nr:hypothetical protein [Lachnospiraceae bacterium]
MELITHVRSTASQVRPTEITPTLAMVRIDIKEIHESPSSDDDDMMTGGFDGFEYTEIRMDLNEYLDYVGNGGNFSEFYTDLDSIKKNKILESKALLAQWLEDNPMKSSCHGGVERTYTVTSEKQAMFTSKYTAHVSLMAAGIPNEMTWNAAGEPCEVWTDPECLAFIAEMNAYVTAVVSKQQHLEVMIGNCQSVEELNAIKIDYSESTAEQEESK